AGFELLLARVSDQRNFVTGIPLSGQAAMGAVQLAGQCTTIMPVVCDLDADCTLDHLVAESRRALMEMHAHGGTRWTAPPLRAMFNMDRAPAMNTFAGFPMTVLTAPIGDAKVDLFANLIDFGDRLAIEFDYRRALIDDRVTHAWSDAYRRILIALSDPRPEVKMRSRFRSATPATCAMTRAVPCHAAWKGSGRTRAISSANAPTAASSGADAKSAARS